MYSKVDFDSIIACLSDYFPLYNKNFDSRSVNDNSCLYRGKLQDLIEVYVPCAVIKSNVSSPWCNRSLRSLSNQKKRLFRTAKSVNTPESWLRYSYCASRYDIELRDRKHMLFYDTLPSILQSNPRQFWSVVNPKPHSFFKLVNDSGTPIPDNECASIFNNVFSSAFTDPTYVSQASLVSYVYFPMDAFIVDFIRIVKIIDPSKISSSCGFHNINYKVLRIAKLTAALFLTRII